MSFGVRAFILVVFSLMSLSFMATTIVLTWEFWSADWLTIANFYSHLFIFFPTFGIVTLIAFYTPACVFLDIYMRHVPHGKLRFALGFLVCAALSLGAAHQLMGSEERSIFEVRPELLLADRGEPAQCMASGQCQRIPVLTAIETVRLVSQSRIGLSDLARNCKPDALKDPPPSGRRYCFASTPIPGDLTALEEKHRSTDAECCAAQLKFTNAVKSMHDSANGRSITSMVHAAMLPFKIFFALILIIISIMLAIRRNTMEEFYPHFLDGIERGVLIGAIAMVVYPIMSHAFLQSAALLYHGAGPTGGFRATAPYISFAFGAWGLLLLFYFYSRRDKEIQSLARIGGMLGSAVAVVKYDQIIDFCVRIFGSGASVISVVIVCGAAIMALLALLAETTREHDSDARSAAPEIDAPAISSPRDKAAVANEN